MKIKQPGPLINGSNKIVDINGPYRDYLMDFEVLKMTKGDIYTNQDSLERVYLIIQGEIKAQFNDVTEVIHRENFYDFDPSLLHLSQNTPLSIECLKDNTEIAVFKTINTLLNKSLVRRPADIKIETRGLGTMNDTGTRITRTIIDYSIDPESNLMIGEDMHYPGKWAGFPSHHHQQPEIYFYKFMPFSESGFGLLKLGDEGVLLQENDTVLVPPGVDHPQVAAPGYGMYFIFAIRHLEGNPYITPTFIKEHLWPAEPGAVIWPDKK
jgi:5-deoxy-glucuronate isomerase